MAEGKKMAKRAGNFFIDYIWNEKLSGLPWSLSWSLIYS